MSGKMPDGTLQRRLDSLECRSHRHLAPGFRPIQKIATILPSSGFIRGNPDFGIQKGLVCLSLRGWAENCVLLPERRQAGRAEICFLFSPIGCHAGPLPSIIAK